MSNRKRKITEDTEVYLGDIAGTCELLSEEVARIKDELFDTDQKVAGPEAFEKLIDDIARKIFEQKMRLEEVKVVRQ